MSKKLNILIKFKESSDSSTTATVNWFWRSNFWDNLFIPNFIIFWHFDWFDIPGVRCMTFTWKGSYPENKMGEYIHNTKIQDRYIYIGIHIIYIYIYIYIYMYVLSWKQCALPVITTMALLSSQSHCSDNLEGTLFS